MESITDYFGSMVFNDEVMKERLPKDVYKNLKRTIDEGKDLDINIANSVAAAMKNWALENGCTHYTHWFQPMTGMTAEKHEAFIVPQEGGSVILEFSGKELIKGEPDASSFPSGGLRDTYEARGYTAWDPTSYAFIKDSTLCIPTAFCSYSGEALDKKTPLLRSMEAINNEAVKILSLFGKNVKRVISTVGSEQEYFLIEKKDYERRKDVIYTGRTLIGARSPKGQEMEDHYFGALRSRVSSYMRDLDKELWKLGINAKTSHNEVAPCQHELALVYSAANLAVDSNQLAMEIMKKTAERHGFACLLHEKPFAGVNGSGKHNNWSLSTDEGRNLFDPGPNPKENLEFLLFLMSVIKAVDEYQGLLRYSVSSAGNDHRLGGNEAPPAILSVFLGEEITEILESIADGKSIEGKRKKEMSLGTNVLATVNKDTTDRNRTSPFAFTGNKFEFRMVGSSFSIAGPNTVLNTIVAKELRDFYGYLKDKKDFKKAVLALIKSTYENHKRIIFNGNNYSDEWVREAKKRGLLNLSSSPEAFEELLSKKNIEVCSSLGVFSPSELKARYEISHEEYVKTIKIELLTIEDMINKQIYPTVMKYTSDIAAGIRAKEGLVSAEALDEEKKRLERIEKLIGKLLSDEEKLEAAEKKSLTLSGAKLSFYFKDQIIPAMEKAREAVDSLELIVSKKNWPYPSYGEMLFYVE